MRLGPGWWTYLFALAPLMLSAVRHGGLPPWQDLLTDLGVGLMVASLVTIMWVQQRRLLRMARTDPLTECYTVRRFSEEFPHAVARASRSGQLLTLLYLDVDDFKTVNDRYGHLKGDEVLVEVARCLRACIRDRVDLPFRLGGDEFAVLLYDAGLDAGLQVGERLRSSLRTGSSTLRELAVTVSIGAVELCAGESPQQFLQRADRAMYDAKHCGKSRLRAA